MPKAKKSEKDVTVISVSVEKLSSDDSASKQKDDWKDVAWISQPEIPFSLLVKTYKESFIVGWIVERISKAANSWFTESGDKELDSLLKSLDAKYCFENLYVCGNVFLEKVRTNDWKVVRLVPFITQEVRVKHEESDGKRVKSYVQNAGGKKQPFEEKEVVHIRLTSMTSRHYGDSVIAKASLQIALLAQIDQYYSTHFDRGFLGTSFLIDKNGKLTDDQKNAIKTALIDRTSGLKNAFTAAIIPTELERLELDKETDTSAFLEYRSALIKSIAIALSIPYDLLISDSSNRSTAETSLETFNKDVIAPLQDEFMRQLRDSLREEFPKIDETALNPVDTSNQLEEMRVASGYVKAGIMTANEARKKLGLEERADGNDFVSTPDNAQQNDPAASGIAKAEEEIRKLYEQITK